jgi:hypothetical protein
MSPELLKKIDEKRGLIPRATYIEYGLKQFLELEDLKTNELKFYKEIQDMLLKLTTEDKRTSVLRGISLTNAKIAERKETLLSMK